MTEMMRELLTDLQAVGNDKQVLVTKYGERQNTLVRLYGGSVSDIPVDPGSEFHRISAKMRLLSTIKPGMLDGNI